MRQEPRVSQLNKPSNFLAVLRGQKQREIIEDSVFGTIVRSALAASDEQKPLREKRLFESVEKNSFQALDEAIHSSPSSF